jgi:hypothetical protein
MHSGDPPTPVSKRDIPLISGFCDEPYVTVELYPKWYDLYVVHPGFRVERVGFDELEKFCGDGSPYSDHCPNPNAVQRLATARGWGVDELALELIVGRWEMKQHPERYET